MNYLPAATPPSRAARGRVLLCEELARGAALSVDACRVSSALGERADGVKCGRLRLEEVRHVLQAET